jgi:hypothetical protein
MSHLRDFVRATADSRDVFPRAALFRILVFFQHLWVFLIVTYIISIMSIEGEITCE